MRQPEKPKSFFRLPLTLVNKETQNVRPAQIANARLPACPTAHPPIAQAKPPASLNDCQAYIQFLSQVYHYTSTCGATHGKSVAALVERNKARFYGYQTLCIIKFGMTRDRESAWSEQALSEYDAAIRQKYHITDRDSDSVREQKAAEYCQSERAKMKTLIKHQFQ